MKSNGGVHPSTDRVFESRTRGKIADGFQGKIPADISGRKTRSLSNIHKHLGPWHHLIAGAKTAAITKNKYNEVHYNHIFLFGFAIQMHGEDVPVYIQLGKYAVTDHSIGVPNRGAVAETWICCPVRFSYLALNLSMRGQAHLHRLPAVNLMVYSDMNSYANRNPLCASIFSTREKSVLTDAIASPRCWMSVSRMVPSHPDAAAR